MPSEEICTHKSAYLPLLYISEVCGWSGLGLGQYFEKTVHHIFLGFWGFFFLPACLTQLRYSLIQKDKKENYWYYSEKLHLDAHVLRYSKSYSWLQILSVFASGEFCIVVKCIDVQQDICYIFQDGLLTQRGKKKKDCVCHVWESYIFILLTWLTLRECFFSSLYFPNSKIQVLLSVPCVSAAYRAALRRALGAGWNPDVLRLPLSLEVGWVWMCHNKHLELRADKCHPLFLWGESARRALPSDQRLCFVGGIWKKLEMLIKGTGWWHWIVTSCNIGFVQMISSNYGKNASRVVFCVESC